MSVYQMLYQPDSWISLFWMSFPPFCPINLILTLSELWWAMLRRSVSPLEGQPAGSRCSELIFWDYFWNISLLDFKVFLLFLSTFAKSLAGVLYTIEQKVARVFLYCFMIVYTSFCLSQSDLLSFGGTFVVISRWWDTDIDEIMFQVLVPLTTNEIPTLIVLNSKC